MNLQQTLNIKHMETPNDILNEEQMAQLVEFVAKQNNVTVEIVTNILKSSHEYMINNIISSFENN